MCLQIAKFRHNSIYIVKEGAATIFGLMLELISSRPESYKRISILEIPDEDRIADK